MRLNKQLSICVGISFVVLTALAGLRVPEESKELKALRFHSGVVTDAIVVAEKGTNSDTYDLNVNEFKKSYSLEDFIKLSMTTTGPQGIHIKEEDSIFSHLNIQKIVNHEGLFSAKESLADYNSKLIKLKKMQRIALYIKKTYSVPLNYSEQIVLTTFVESKKKNLDPNLVLSVIGVESTFKQYVKSGSGAIGLTQVIPKWHPEKIAKLKNQDMWSIPGNIKVGTEVLREYMDLSGGNTRSALQRYNGTLGDPTSKYSNKVFTKLNKFNSLDKF